MNSDELDLTLNFIINYPQAAAREIEKQSVESTILLMAQLPATVSSALFFQLLPAHAAKLLKQLPSANYSVLFLDAKAEKISSILRYLDDSQREIVLSQLPKKTATICQLLLSYTLDTVGAWMIADILMLPLEIDVSEALELLANSGELLIADVLAVVDIDKHLIGTVSLKKLLTATSETPLNRLVQKKYCTLKSRASLSSIAEDKGWLEFDILYVLNRNQQLVGMLRHLDFRLSQQIPVEGLVSIQTDELTRSLTKSYFDTLGALFGLFLNGESQQIKTQAEPLINSEKLGL